MIKRSKNQTTVIRNIFEEIEDPRSEKNTQHLLIDIFMLTICAIICGAEGWEDIETFGKAREAWLRQFLLLPYGIPGHDTIRRLFARVNPHEIQHCFRRWIRAVFKLTQKQVVAIDGKSVRRSYEDATDKNKGMLHMVSAWATENGIVLGQVKTNEKSNEIRAIPELLDVLAIKGCIVTIDALGCQRDIAKQITDQKGDYLLAVKENQGKLYHALISTFEKAQELSYKGMVYQDYKDIDAGHGRIETRQCTVLPIMYLHSFKLKWKGLKSVVLIERQRELKDRVETEKRYYISSLELDAELIANAVRQHWAIENQLHWVLDVVFREDYSRIRKDKAAENMVVMRHLALNLLKSLPSSKFSIKKEALSCYIRHYFSRKNTGKSINFNMLLPCGGSRVQQRFYLQIQKEA